MLPVIFIINGGRSKYTNKQKKQSNWCGSLGFSLNAFQFLSQQTCSPKGKIWPRHKALGNHLAKIQTMGERALATEYWTPCRNRNNTSANVQCLPWEGGTLEYGKPAAVYFNLGRLCVAMPAA